MDLPQAETQTVTVTETVHVPFLVTSRPVFVQNYDGSFVNLSSIKQLYVYHGKIAGY